MAWRCASVLHAVSVHVGSGDCLHRACIQDRSVLSRTEACVGPYRGSSYLASSIWSLCVFCVITGLIGSMAGLSGGSEGVRILFCLWHFLSTCLPRAPFSSLLPLSNLCLRHSLPPALPSLPPSVPFPPSPSLRPSLHPSLRPSLPHIVKRINCTRQSLCIEPLPLSSPHSLIPASLLL